ncbi:helix-turn-helix domain-containing protein [Thalassobaculum sp.]|uniref:helix-turn-helix domain-containing protein n=1 Tax=Thalassobaculum sp. TaxID=2022740 RepID=UPI0032EB26CD
MLKQQQIAPERVAVSIDDAAAMAGIGRTTLYAALARGGLPSLKIGKRRLVQVEALKAWLDAHAVANATDAA